MNFVGFGYKNAKLCSLQPGDHEFKDIDDYMQSTIVEHEDNVGGIFDSYTILKV